MTKFRELSRLPDDPAYWAAFETRILHELGPRVRDGATTVSVWAPVARHAWKLFAFGVAAAAGSVMLIPQASAQDQGARALLRPSEPNPAWAAYVQAGEPRSVTSLVLPPARGARND